MTFLNAIQNTVLANLLDSIKGNDELKSSDNYEFLFEEVQNAVFGDTVELSSTQGRQINWIIEDIMAEAMKGNLWQDDNLLNFFEFGFNKNRKNIQGSTKQLRTLWQNNSNTRTRKSSNRNTTERTSINNDGLTKIRNLKSQTLVQQETNIFNEPVQRVVEQEIDPLEGKTPEEKKTILDQTIQAQRENINSIQNGTNEVVQYAEQQLQNAENAMNAAIDRDASINEEVKTQIKESESAITAKSQEISSKEAEIALTDASITQTESSIASLQSSLSSLAQPTGAEGDEEKDAKLNARRSELQSQIAAKQAELAQLQAQKQQQEAEKAQLEGEKGQLETQKNEIMDEELKDASPATKAAIQAYENSRTNVENTKTNELQNAQAELNDTIQKLGEVEAEIEQQKNNKANTNFDINGLIEAFAQGSVIGDCWFLSSLETLSNTEEGRKILQDAVQINDDGTYTVKFNGVDWAATFTDNDLRAARNSGNYSSGDDDVLLMEVAAQRFLEQARNGEVNLTADSQAILGSTISEGDNTPLTSGNSLAALHLFTGATQSNYGVHNFGDSKESGLDTFLDDVQNNGSNTFATLTFVKGGNTSLNTLNSGAVATGSDATGSHLWSVKSVSGNNVTLINPWNSSEEVITTRDELRRNNVAFDYTTLAA